MGRVPILLALLLMVPAAAAVPFETSLPETLSFREGLLLVGALEADAPWQDPLLLHAQAFTFADGLLTVCPRDRGTDLLAFLADLQASCDGAQTFRDASLAFGPGTDIRFGGAADPVDHVVDRMPAATMAMPAGTGPVLWPMLMSLDGVRLARPADRFAFAATDGAGSVHVHTPDEEAWFNGTDWAFLHDGPVLDAVAAGVATAIHDGVDVRLRPGAPDAVAALPDPYLMLTLQERLLSADEREPRKNATALLTTYGRVAHHINGAVVGAWNGTIDGRRMPDGVALVRLDQLSGRIEDGTLAGDVGPAVRVADDRVGFGDGRLWGPPWVLAAVLWAGAIAVALLRHHPVPLTRGRRAMRAGAWLLGLLLVDLWVLRRGLGAGILGSLDASPASRIAILVFGLVATASTWLLVHQPLRIVAAKALPLRWHGWGDAAAMALWLLFLLLWPASVTASGLTWARL